MHHSRLTAARRILRTHRCTHLLVSDPVAVEYLTGFRSSRARLLVTPRHTFLFTDFRYREAAERMLSSATGTLVLIRDDEASCIAEKLLPGSIVGFQSDSVTVEEFGKLKSAARRVKFVPIAGEISALSSVKTDPEIAAIRKAAAIGDRAFERFCRALKPGMTESGAASLLDRFCLEGGSAKSAFDTIVLFGKHCALPHGHPGATRLRRGDFVLVDFGCVVDGFCSDMTRTLVMGKVSPKQREIYSLVERAQAAACGAAKAGMTGRRLDGVARKIIEEAGYGETFGHGLGHGVGLRVHEEPRVSKAGVARLREGTVFTIEPGIYLPGFGGVRIEDTVLMTDRGVRRLTRFPRKLVELRG